MENGLCTIHNRGTKYEVPGDIIDKIFNNDSGASKYIRHHMIQSSRSSEFHFQRHSACTNSIMDYFLGDELHMPFDVCPSKFRDEMRFWGVKEHAIGSCCFTKYVSFFEEKEGRDKLENNKRKDKETTEYINSLSKGDGWSAVQAKVWKVIEYPSSSMYARVFWLVSNLFVVASLIEVVYLTNQQFGTKIHVQHKDQNSGNDSLNTTAAQLPQNVQYKLITYFENILMGYFTSEMIFKLVFFPLPWRRFITFSNVIDGFALAAMYVSLISYEVLFSSHYEDSPLHVVVDCIQIIRIFRLFRLVKYTTSFSILTYTLIASARELLLLLFCLFAAVFVFSVLAYATYDEAFTSVAESSWWAIITLTTVGYGDVVPTTIPGKVVASACAVTGVCLISMLVPIFVNNLLVFYSHSKILDKRDKGTEKPLQKNT